MRDLSQQDLTDLVEGAAVFSSGGGGDPVVGLNVVEKLLEKRRTVRLIEPSEVPEDAVVVSFACVGATANVAYHGDAAVKTLSSLEKFLGTSVFALIPVELGAFSTLAALDVAARHGIPVVDADGAGRAVPETHLQAYMIDGVASAPTVIADLDAKKTLLVKRGDPKSVEQIARRLSAEWNQMVYAAGVVLTGKQVRSSPVLNTLSTSIRMGMLLRKAVDPLRAILRENSGFSLFEGVVTDLKNETKDAFTWTTLEMTGTHSHEGSELKMKSKNGFLIAYKDRKPVAMAPDIITVVNSETCKTVPAENTVEGNKLVILGIPAPPQWRTRQGLHVWEEVMRRSDINEQYMPIEKLAK